MELLDNFKEALASKKKEWQNAFLKFKQSKHQFLASIAFKQAVLAKNMSSKLTLLKIQV